MPDAEVGSQLDREPIGEVAVARGAADRVVGAYSSVWRVAEGREVREVIARLAKEGVRERGGGHSSANLVGLSRITTGRAFELERREERTPSSCVFSPQPAANQNSANTNAYSMSFRAIVQSALAVPCAAQAVDEVGFRTCNGAAISGRCRASEHANRACPLPLDAGCPRVPERQRRPAPVPSNRQAEPRVQCQ